MGFSSVAAVAVLMTAILVSAIYLYGTIDASYSKISEAYISYTEYIHSKLNEKLELYEIKNSSTQINITLINNGSVVLEPSDWSVLYNGKLTNFTYVPSDMKYLTPLNNVTLVINVTPPGRVCVVTEYGNRYCYYVG